MTAILDAAAATAAKPYRLTATDGASPDPILVEIVAGYLASVEMEVETSISRTSRSPMIRDAHDFRAGIHDRNLRKLTGRSYSALVHPIARDFPLETMKPGDVYFHNDVYLSEGGIGHLPPDLCVTVPVFARVTPPMPSRKLLRSFRHSVTTTTSAVAAPRLHAVRRHHGVRRGTDGSADQTVGPGSSQRGGAAHHDA